MPCQKKELVRDLREGEGISVARACSMYYYTPVKDDSAVEEKLWWYAEKLPARGFPEYYRRMRKEGLGWNHKRVYRKLGLSHRKKVKRRVPNPSKQVLLQPLNPNQTWSIDFMEDRLDNGRKFRR
jgi:hypothetical protein